MKEHGNYTNASAGYLGNPNFGGVEEGWKYMRRDTNHTIGSGGSNVRIGMDIRVIVPRWTRYVTVLSKKHSAKIADHITGQRRFPKLPTTTPGFKILNI